MRRSLAAIALAFAFVLGTLPAWADDLDAAGAPARGGARRVSRQHPHRPLAGDEAVDDGAAEGAGSSGDEDHEGDISVTFPLRARFGGTTGAPCSPGRPAVQTFSAPRNPRAA